MLVALATAGPPSAQAQSSREIHGVYRVVVVSEFPRGTNRAAFNERQAQLPVAQRQQPPAVQEGEDLTNSSGTGFLAAGRRMVITNNHVVDPPTQRVNNQVVRSTPQIYALLFNVNGVSREVRGRLVATLPAKDLAIIEAVEDLPGTAHQIADYDPSSNSELEAVGFPGIADFASRRSANRMPGFTKDQLEPIKTQGRMQRAFDVNDAQVVDGTPRLTSRLLLHTTPFSPGNSGGPLFNRCGQVVGVNTFTATDRNVAATIFHSIHSREVVQFLRAQSQQPRVAASFCLLPGSWTDYLTLPSFLGLGALLLALTAVILAKQRPQVIQQTVSRVQNSFSKLNRTPQPAPPAAPRSASPAADRGASSDGTATAVQRDSGRRAITPANPVLRLVPTSGGTALEIAANRLTGGQAIIVGRSLELMQEQDPHDHPIVISDKTVSRRHARLTLEGSRLMVEDLGSSAGTFKGAARIDKDSFSNGDEVRFGSAGYRIALPTV